MTHDQVRKPEDELAPEIRALREILGKVMRIEDVHVQAPLAARISSVIVQAARAQHFIGDRRAGTFLDELKPILEELDHDGNAKNTNGPGSGTRKETP